MASVNHQLTTALVTKLKQLGVKKIVVCAGSRNAPLIFAAEASAHFTIYHHLDERSAGFFALGLASVDREPTAIVTTSGTAVAELLPCVVEAYYQRLPLIMVTADRPESFRGSGAPQTIDQPKIFSSYADAFDITSVEVFANVRRTELPLHLNICIEEPKAGDWPDPGEIEVSDQPSTTRPDRMAETSDSSTFYPADLSAFVAKSDRLLVVVGSLPQNEAPFVAKFLKDLGAPVLADTSSNLPSELALRCGEKVLRELPPTHVLRLGSVPSFRFWRDLETNGRPVLSITLTPFTGLGRESRMQTIASYVSLANFSDHARDLSYAQNVQAGDAHATERLNQLLEKYAASELALLRRVSLAMQKHDALYLGNSLPIREWSLVNGSHDACFANRGANGIDGQISSYLGVAENFAQSWGIFGDQTAMYDLNALAIRRHFRAHEKSAAIKRRIVVVNNGGGKIFSQLGYSATLTTPQRNLLENNHRFQLRAWADLFAWGYESWEHGFSGVPSVVDDLILEIFPDPNETLHFWQEWRRA